MKPIVINSTNTSAGRIAVVYADTADDLSGDEYIGVDKRQLASGSVAYLKNQDTLIFDSTHHWVTDDGKVIDNYVKDWVIPMQKFSATNVLIPKQTFTGGSGVELNYNEYLKIFTINGDQIKANFVFDNVEYGTDDVFYNDRNDDYRIGDWDDPTFTLRFNLGGTVQVTVNDENEHTLVAYSTNDFYAYYLENPELNGDITVSFDGTIYDAKVKTNQIDYYGADMIISETGIAFDFNTYPFCLLPETINYAGYLVIVPNDNEHTIGAYVMKKEAKGELVEFASFTFVGEAGPPNYYVGMGNRTIPFIKNAIVTFDGTEYEMERGEVDGALLYGEFDGDLPSLNTYPFATLGGSSIPIFLVGDANEHTISFSGNVSFVKVFDGNVTVSGGMAELSNSSLIEDKKSYKVVFDGTEYYGTAIYYDDPEEPATELVLSAHTQGDNPSIGAEGGATNLLYPNNGTYDLSLYEIVE